MKKKLLREWYFKKKEFSRFLAFHQKDSQWGNSELWACLQLGMYEIILSTKVEIENWHSLFAHILANATRGNNEKVFFLLNNLEHCKKCSKHIKFLINALSPLFPQQALVIAKKYKKIPYLLELSLLIELDKYDVSILDLSQKIKNKYYRKQPESLLFYSNLNKNFLSKEKLTLLNKFLLFFNLSKIRLKDYDKPINIHNFLSPNINYNCNDTDLVTVVMTTYNSSITLQTALDSILVQSYRNLEIIIVDDASSDETVSMIKNYIQKDDRIKLISLNTNVGTYVAKNIALKVAKGKFITCHDSDDFSHISKIEKQVLPLINNDKLIATISNWIRIDDNGNYYTRHLYPFTRLNLSSLMFRREDIATKIGFYDSVRTGADSEFLARLKLAFNKKNILKIKKPLSFGAHRENSLMNAKDTGHNKDGLSLDRLEYWESWNQWHIDVLRENSSFYIGLNNQRLFNAPKKIVVNSEDILKVNEESK